MQKRDSDSVTAYNLLFNIAELLPKPSFLSHTKATRCGSLQSICKMHISFLPSPQHIDVTLPHGISDIPYKMKSNATNRVLGSNLTGTQREVSWDGFHQFWYLIFDFKLPWSTSLGKRFAIAKHCVLFSLMCKIHFYWFHLGARSKVRMLETGQNYNVFYFWKAFG